MLPEYKTKSNIGIASGFGAQIVGFMLPEEPAMIGLLSLLLLLGGVVLICWGCVCYAKGKGRSGFWGILGITSLLGLIILVLLPDDYS